MPYPINQRAHQFNSIQSVPVSFGLWDTALKFPSPGPRSDVTDHLEQTEPTRKESHIYGIWADWWRQRQIYIKSKQWWKYWNPLMWRKFNFWMVLWWAPDLAKFLPNLLTAWSRYTNTPARIVICIWNMHIAGLLPRACLSNTDHEEAKELEICESKRCKIQNTIKAHRWN